VSNSAPHASTDIDRHCTPRDALCLQLALRIIQHTGGASQVGKRPLGGGLRILGTLRVEAILAATHGRVQRVGDRVVLRPGEALVELQVHHHVGEVRQREHARAAGRQRPVHHRALP